MHLDEWLGLAGAAGWVGWAAGVGAVLLELRGWRKDRREGPVMRELAERELRDKKGKYTEEQIEELAGVFERLTRQVRDDVPAVARRALIESRRDQLAGFIEKDFREYHALSKRLGEAPTPGALSPELRESIRAEIVPSADRRNRQLRGAVAAAIVIGLLIIFPYPQHWALNTLDVGSGQSAVYAEENIFPYSAGLVISFVLAVYSSWSRFQPRIARTRTLVTILIGSALLCLWVLSVAGILLRWIINPGVQNIAAIASLIFFWAGVRTFYLLWRWRRVG
jgi:hypothetical protein